MQADECLVIYIATTYYNLRPILGSIKPLCGYSAKNFLFTDAADHKSYVLKIVDKEESIKEVTDIIDEVIDNAYAFSSSTSPSTTLVVQGPSFVVPKVIRTTGDKLSTYTSVRYQRKSQVYSNENLSSDLMDDSIESFKCNIKLFEYFHGITMFDYINNEPAPLSTKQTAISKLRGETLYRKLGHLCSELFVFLSNQRHLVERLRQARGNSFPWQITTCEPHLRRILEKLYPEERHVRRLLVERILKDYNQNIKPELKRLPEFILHSDLCSRNILLNWEPNSPYAEKFCLIDFQDLQVGQQVVELAIFMLYNVIEQKQVPFEKALKLIPRWILLGYQSNPAFQCQIGSKELLLVPTLMKLRLCMSLLNGLLAFKENPENAYVLDTNQQGWQLLELMSGEDSEFGSSRKLVNYWLNG